MITAASYVKYEEIGDRVYQVIVQITDTVNGVSKAAFRVYGATTTELRNDASRQIAAMNDREKAKTALDGIPAGTNIPVTAPSDPAPTAAEVWRAKAQRLATARALGTLTGQIATDITALATDVQNTYVAGYLDTL